MSTGRPLPAEFYDRHPLTVARELLGKKLVRDYNGNLLSGMIRETEAYLGEEDSASHAYKGKTRRNAVLYGEAGRAYVYFIYGMYHMLNVVAGKPGIPWAVLIRSLEPMEGMEAMQKLRGRKTNLTDGPGKLCRALAIDTDLNGCDLTKGSVLWIEPYRRLSRDQIVTGPRIGIEYAEADHRASPWRFTVKNNQGRNT